MALLKSTFKRWNGSAWDIHYFRTSADIIDETTTYKVMTATERTAISTYLTTFNAANKLLQLDGSGLIPIGLIPGGLNYLTINNPTFTGILKGKLQEGSWLADSSLFKLSSHNASEAGSGIPGFIEFKAVQGDYVDLELNAATIYLKSTNPIDAGAGKITNLASPTLGSDAATKTYVDGLVATGTKPRSPVKAATTVNITLSGLQSIDGYTTVAGDRILVKNQTTTSQNGVYTASATAWSKVAADSVTGVLVFVESGSTNNDTQYYASTDTSWILFSRVDTITASGGLQKVGTDISVASLGITNAMLAGSIAYTKLANTAIVDSLGAWTNPSYGAPNVANTLTVWLQSALSAIKQLRGTANYNTDNAETIAGAYTLAAAKNRTYTGNSDPGTTGYVAGDLFFQDIV